MTTKNQNPQQRLDAILNEVETLTNERELLEAQFDEAATAGNQAKAHEIQAKIDSLDTQQKFLNRQINPLEQEIRKLAKAEKHAQGRKLAKNADDLLADWTERLTKADALLAEVDGLLAGIDESGLMKWKSVARQSKELGGQPRLSFIVPSAASNRAAKARQQLEAIRLAFSHHSVQVRDTRETA